VCGVLHDRDIMPPVIFRRPDWPWQPAETA